MKIFFTIVSMVFVVSFDLQSQVTFSKHVAPIIFKHCVSCHRDGEIAPFSLSNYEEVSQMAYTIKAVVHTGTMPPWKAEQGYGDFLDERLLTQQEKEIISQWIDGGLEEGNKGDLPTLPDFPKGSQLGVPDLVLKLKNPWKIESNYKDNYRNFVLDLPIDQDYDVAAIEFRPGNAKVVHHALMWLDTTGESTSRDIAEPGDGYDGFGGPGFNPTLSYGGWVPGATSRFYPPGIGNKMYKSGKVLVQIHYAPSVTEEYDQSTINVFFKKNENNVRQVLEFPMSVSELENKPFIIPANERKKFRGSYFVPIDASIASIAPHQHLLGANAKAYAVTILGDTIPLVNIPSWDFNWQGAFTFQKLVKIPMFSTLYYEAEYDNTTDNPFNPNNPPKITRWGENTSDEMYLCYFHFLLYEPGDENIVMGPAKDTTISSVNYPYITGFPKSSIVEVYPNPAVVQSTIRIYNPIESFVSLKVISIDGVAQQVVLEPTLYSQGYHSVSLSSANLAIGKYLLQLHSPNGVHSSPLTIVK
jgi:hypothetical protein